MDALKTRLVDAGIDCASLAPLSSRCGQPMYSLTIAGGDDALKASRRMRAVSGDTGYWPVIIGTPDDWRGRDFEQLPGPQEIRETLAGAQLINVSEWFSEQHQKRLDDFRDFDAGEESALCFAETGDWPSDVQPATSLYTVFDGLRGKPHAEVRCALIPTKESWQAPAYLGFGGWNDCPEDSIQCAVFKYWRDRWGADIVVIANDVIEAAVEHPPVSPEDAVKLAQEQYEFCADIVEQGTQTLPNLAARLLNGPLWFFWWD